MKFTLRLYLVALLFAGCFSPALAVSTTPTILPYEGVLKTPLGVAITTAQDFRFSLWNDSDYDAPADFDGAGDIPGVAPGFSGYREEQTVTPDTSGFFQINIRSITPIPDFIITDHLYLQVEIMPNGAPETSYEVLDVIGIDNTDDRQEIGKVPYASNADFRENEVIGTGARNISVLGIGGVFSESFILGG